MLNLNTTHSLTDHSQTYRTDSLPVLVDLNWLGRTMTLPDAGIIPSRASLTPSCPSNDESSEVIL